LADDDITQLLVTREDGNKMVIVTIIISCFSTPSFWMTYSTVNYWHIAFFLGNADRVTFPNAFFNMIICQVFFEEQLKKHDGTCALIQANLDAQPKILK